MNMMHKPERCCHGHEAATCTQCRTGSRNHYYRRKMMTAEDFRAEQDYMIGRRRLMNRSMYGWGVVFGLAVKRDDNSGNEQQRTQDSNVSDQAGQVGGGRLIVDPGLALDRYGRELMVPEDQCLSRHNLFVAGDTEHRRKPQGLSTLKRGFYLLSAHYAERGIDPVRLSDACDCIEQEWNRICETVVYSLSPIDKCPSAESGCPHDCGCPVTDEPAPASQETSRNDAADARTQMQTVQRGAGGVEHKHPPRDPSSPRSHHVLCCWSDHAEVAGRGTVCHWRDGIWIDPCEGVPLACVEFVEIECCEPVFGAIDDCTPRRIVKRNDMLFDLVRGCDLTRIDYLSWLHWPCVKQTQSRVSEGQTRLVTWEVFSAAIIQDVPAFAEEKDYSWLKDTDWYKQYDPSRERLTKFEIGFSGPVRTKTVIPDAISITGNFPDEGTGWNKPLRLPITRILTRPADPGDPKDTTRRAMIVVHQDWVHDEIASNKSEFRVDEDREYYPFLEVEIFGDLLEDCRGVPVDANSAGQAIVPTGNGTPGGTCRSVFQVTPKPRQ